MNDQSIVPEILDKITKVCICKSITKATIRRAISEGAKSVAEVQKVTGAGGGSCGGRRCTPKIHQLIEKTIYDREGLNHE